MYNKKEQTDKGVSFMEGRRVSRRKPRRNPLYTLFMGLLALSLVLFITVIVLSFKLKGARRDLADAQTKIEQLRGGSQTGEDNQLTNGEDGLLDGDAGETGGTQGNDSTNSEKIDWLDLTGHTEVAVKPNSVYDKYYIYYTTGGVNLRSGPGTSYDKITTVGNSISSTYLKHLMDVVGGQFGWINSDYLVTTRPAS